MADWTEGIEDALTYIEMHLTEALEIREIAKRACVSPFYFQRIFLPCAAWELASISVLAD